MNFWDTPIGTDEAVSTPPTTGHERQQSLNEEVTEVMGQLNRFWDGFRKQSQDALLAARKDLGQYATQAQQYASQAGKELEKEFSKLGIVNQSSSSPQIRETPGADGEASTSGSASLSSSSTLPDPSDTPTSPTTSSNLFARLQDSLPPDLVNTLQSHLPESIRHAPERLDLTQLRSTLQRVRLQDATARGEELLKSAGDFLRDAVRVVPPPTEEESAGLSSRPKGKAPMRDGAIGTRKDALFRALRSNAAILRIDPAAEKSSEAMFKTWEEKQVAASDGGILGATWQTKIDAELKDAGESLSALREELVPSTLTEEAFWTRYFFRVFQIEQEEERRKALLAGMFFTSHSRTALGLTWNPTAGSSQTEDDFSWEDEEEDTTSPTDTLRDRAAPSSADRKTLNTFKANSLAPTPGTSSPSQSEGSYDIVSGHVSNASESAPTPQPTVKTSQKGTGAVEDESEDSDWE
ncbi:hypothetical protein K488DRAFT_89433 [Vararia minispora EC-137]|uniref:Uncharacterized protein n=1 Tax=Vararia minispora EC-137 TaxID=1314806 RepID=A0ACB8QAC5_9AGAM|nr:hypothetical protein K488DRAFT_89433 [Vararia minispora EC-137]